MITVGLVRELLHIARFTQTQLEAEFPLYDLRCVVTPQGDLDVYCREHHIWRESIDDDVSFFGVESCHTISCILFKIQNNDDSWKTITFKQTS